MSDSNSDSSEAEKKALAELAIRRILEKVRVQQAAIQSLGAAGIVTDKPAAKPNVGAFKNILKRTLNANDARSRRKRSRRPSRPSASDPPASAAPVPRPMSSSSRLTKRKRKRWDQPRATSDDETASRRTAAVGAGQFAVLEDDGPAPKRRRIGSDG